jgi:UDP-N-acetylglucosamine--N-acetylmuramyl-(pentapeptide) pyrophosphoryl-undecaprenol N-acetylglucosamine transferase
LKFSELSNIKENDCIGREKKNRLADVPITGSMKIVIAAGGSGGHLLPAQQLANELQEEAEILFAGHCLDSSPFFRRESFPFQSIRSAPLRWSIKGLYTFIKEAGLGFLEGWRLIRSFRPDLVIGFGSFHTFPLLLAASVLRRKIVLFEANCILGKVNRLFAPCAQIVASQFPFRDPIDQKFVPLLPWGAVPLRLEKKEARGRLGLALDRPAFLVFGGSQGARFLNQTIPFCLPPDAQAIHLAGTDEAASRVAEMYYEAHIPAIVKRFESDMPAVYAAVDFAICRSGAGTLAELIRYSLPALLIPFPFAADDHQRLNAEFLAKKIGGAKMLNETSANERTISQAIAELLAESHHLHAALDRYRNECEGRVRFSRQILKIGRDV